MSDHTDLIARLRRPKAWHCLIEKGGHVEWSHSISPRLAADALETF